MAFVIADRVRETTTTTGTGAVTLAGAYTSFQTFSAAIGNGNNTYYTIASPTTGDWEVGVGTYSSGTNTLSRDTVLASSNAGNLVVLGAGSKDVFVTEPAERALLIQAAGTGLVSKVAAFTNSGVLYATATTTVGTSSNLTFDGTTLTANALTLTNNPTLNGGTANGVLYLNGSKVATSGSALTFDGSTLTNTNSGQGFLQTSTSVSTYASFKGNTGGTTIWTGIGTDTGVSWVGSVSNNDLSFRINNSEQMRLTSTGLGIGTSSPAAKLHSVAGTGVDALMLARSTSNNWALGPGSGTGNYGIFGIVDGANLRVAIDSSGNLGIGTSSPTDTSGFSRALDLNGTSGAAFYARTNGSTTNYTLFGNYGVDGYINNRGAGTIQFYNNNAERMRIDSSGNVGIGTSSPNSKLNVSAATSTIGQLRVDGTGTGAGAVFAGMTAGSIGFLHSNTGILAFGTSTTDNNLTERMRIDSSGRLLIGTTSASGSNYLQVNSDALISGLTVGKGAGAVSSNTAVGASALAANTTGSTNTAVGNQAMALTTTGTASVAVGLNAAYSNTTGSANTALGQSALFSNTTASNNTAVGYQSLYSNTGSSGNTAIGYQAALYNTGGALVALGYQALAGASGTSTGAYNTAIGYQSLAANTTGQQNTGLGYQALQVNTTGASNTAIGMYALVSNTTGNNNTAVGYQAGYSNTTSTDNTYIGYQAGFSTSTGTGRSVAVGKGALYSATTATDNTAVGYYAGVAITTGVANAFFGGGLYGIAASTGGSTTTGSYNTGLGIGALASNTTASNNTAVGYRAAYSNTTGADNTVVGRDALFFTTTGSENTAIGWQSLYSNSTGNNNTAIGQNALLNNTTASNNTAVGYQAGYSNTTGDITAFGYLAGYSNTTGGGNSALGYRALYTNQTGTNNTAVGENSMYYTTGSWNLACGTGALFTNSSGNYNTAVGGSALNANTTGNNNTAVGYQALYSQTTSGSNTAIGIQAGYYITTGQNNTIIGGYNGNQGGLDIRTSSNYIVLSDGAGNPRGVFDGNGNLGVGTTSPSGRRLYVAGSNAGYIVSIENTIASGPYGMQLYYSGSTPNTTDNQFIFCQDATASRFIVYSNGNAVNRNNSYGAISDIKLKENIVDATPKLADLMKVQIRNYNLKSDPEHKQIGVIAQELEQVFPSMVDEAPDRDTDGNDLGTTTKQVKYSVFVPMLIKAIQELKAEVDSLKSQLKGA